MISTIEKGLRGCNEKKGWLTHSVKYDLICTDMNNNNNISLLKLFIPITVT